MAMSAARSLRFEVMTNEELTDPIARFDRREMLIIHDLLRREFALMPGLVDAVPLGDRDRARLVGDHIDRLTVLLHHHHSGEDTNVWPLLADRCAESVAALIATMHDQHEQLAALLDALNAALAVWRVDATADSGHRLADVLDQTLSSLRTHLDDEERHFLPLLEQHISAAEWDGFVQKGSADADPAELPLLFGMLMYEGDPEIIERVLAAMPADARRAITATAAQTFAEHSRAIHNTPTPPRSFELMQCRHA
jgi:Hemerythrin HHE cation binding domain